MRLIDADALTEELKRLAGCSDCENYDGIRCRACDFGDAIGCVDDFGDNHQKTIDYQACSDAMLKMWMENILTDGEYNRVMDKLNKAHGDGRI